MHSRDDLTINLILILNAVGNIFTVAFDSLVMQNMVLPKSHQTFNF